MQAVCCLTAVCRYCPAEVTPGQILTVIRKVPENLMPTSQNKLVPVEAAYSDDESEVALVKENKEVSHFFMVVA